MRRSHCLILWGAVLAMTACNGNSVTVDAADGAASEVSTADVSVAHDAAVDAPANDDSNVPIDAQPSTDASITDVQTADTQPSIDAPPPRDVELPDTARPIPDGFSPDSGPSDDAEVNPIDSGLCNNLVDDEIVVAANCVTGAFPTGTGGPIHDGRYNLSAFTFYGTICTAQSQSTTLLISGTSVESAASSSGTQSIETSTIVTTGNTIVINQTCPFASSSPPGTYTADQTTFTIFIPISPTSGIVEQFTLSH